MVARASSVAARALIGGGAAFRRGLIGRGRLRAEPARLLERGGGRVLGAVGVGERGVPFPTQVGDLPAGRVELAAEPPHVPAHRVPVGLGLHPQRRGGRRGLPRPVCDPLRLPGAGYGLVGLAAGGVGGLLGGGGVALGPVASLAGRVGVQGALLGRAAGVVAFGLRGRDRIGRLRPHLRDLPLHPGRRQLGVQGVRERLDHLVEPVDDLPRPGDLTGQPRRPTLAHPRVPGRLLALTVVVPAVPEGPPGTHVLLNGTATVGAGPGLDVNDVHGERTLPTTRPGTDPPRRTPAQVWSAFGSPVGPGILH